MPFRQMYKIENKVKSSYPKFYMSIITVLLILQTNSIYSESNKAKSLEVGNKWFFIQYEEGRIRSYYSKKVIGDTLINNTQYAIIIAQYDLRKFKEFERADSNKIYEYRVADSTEIPIMDFSVIVGDSLNVKYNYVVDKIEMNFFWGKPRKFIYVNNDFSYLYHELACFIEGIGLFSSQKSGLAIGAEEEEELNGAIIDHTVYGDTLLTDIKNHNNENLNEFDLSQNYPNPFNSKTVIEYKLTISTNIEISLYNLLGKKLQTLESGMKDRGMHQLILSNETLSSGIYIYKLKSNDTIKIRKCMCIK